MAREDTLAAFKARLRQGEHLLGVQHNSASSAVVEVIAYAGFDFVILDQEHSAYSSDTMERLVLAAEAAGLVAFVRLIKNDKHLIMQALDAGAQGVLVPHVMSAEDCSDAIAAARYQPVGRRGKSAGSRAARWGLSSWAEYQAWANAEPLVIPIIEDRESVDRMEEILATEGLELISVGPGDLSQSYSRPNEGLRAEPVMEALRRAIRYCAPRGIGVMTIPVPDMTPEFVRELAREGARVSWYGGDLSHLGRLLSALAVEAREPTTDPAN